MYEMFVYLLEAMIWKPAVCTGGLIQRTQPVVVIDWSAHVHTES